MGLAIVQSIGPSTLAESIPQASSQAEEATFQ